MKASARPIVAAVLLLVAAVAFWNFALSPKRQEADKLAAQIETVNAGIQTARSEVTQASAARRTFPAAYHQLVELGQAVPSSDETPSLLVELQTIAAVSGVSFDSIQLESEGGETGGVAETGEASASTAEGSSATSASEVAASLMPLGASIGTAGLAVMPYNLQFQGNFFQIGVFIDKLDSLVQSKANSSVSVDGRLITINGFSLAGETGESESGRSTGRVPKLKATISVTTYLTPPGQGITAGATPSAPEPTSTETVAAE